MHCQHLLFDPARIPSPCFVLDENQLLTNAAILNTVQERTGAKILLALKGYAAWATFPLLSRFKGHGPLWGACASSVDEARLAREEFGGEVHSFAAAWNRREVAELLTLTDHIVFNSIAQWREFAPAIEAWNQGRCPDRQIQCGLRINPEHSEGAAEIYNPCAPGSRLGIRRKHYDPTALDGISGLHFHTLCEQGSDALERTLAAVEKNFGQWLPRCKWINMGGGHHITKPDYDLYALDELLYYIRAKYPNLTVYLEPGEAVALYAGWLDTTVLDIVENGMPILILDASAACHMPDVLEMPYRPPLKDSGEADEKQYTYRLSSMTCLAGDVIGDYSFDHEIRIGDRLYFEDMAIYSMVKNNTFNGMCLPSIARLDENGECSVVKTFGYEEFVRRLG